ncbi:MAG TPA: NUDIX hydrolase [Spirochaetia bacterium]|nr:NUDIX hydrolase [Spirochaetia bacterium]
MALKITGERDIAVDPYLILKERTFLDRSGHERRWTYVARQSEREAVVIVPVTRMSRSLIVIRQYRVPFGAPVIEFPAGLVDPGEKPEQTAIRELLEETGYRGVVRRVGPAVSTSAGITTEKIYMAFVEADEMPDTAAAETPESSEEIEVIRVGPHELRSKLDSWELSGELLDVKLYAYLSAKLEFDGTQGANR